MMRYSNTSLNSKFERLPGTRKNLISLSTPSPSSTLPLSVPPSSSSSLQNSPTHKRSLSPPPASYIYDYASNLPFLTDMESDPPSSIPSSFILATQSSNRVYVQENEMDDYSFCFPHLFLQSHPDYKDHIKMVPTSDFHCYQCATPGKAISHTYLLSYANKMCAPCSYNIIWFICAFTTEEIFKAIWPSVNKILSILYVF
jgi:hypothetical protein